MINHAKSQPYLAHFNVSATFNCGIMPVNIKISNERLIELISQVDENKNGTLEFSEFVMVVNS